MKVLVIQNKMIGDVLASSVICEALKTENPNWEVHYMIEPNTVPVIENNPFIDKIILFESKKNKGFVKLKKNGKLLKNEKYSLVIDAYGKWESIIPAFFSGAKSRIGLHKKYTATFYSETVVPDKKGNGTANAFRLLLAKTALKKEIETIYPKIHLSGEEIQKAKNKISENLNPLKPIYFISVLGSNINKSLPPKYMAKVLDQIALERDVQLVFNYIPNQREQVDEIYKLCLEETKSKINLDFYATDLRDFLGLLSQCDALIGNEGGATNMAKALSIPTFTIYAPWINKTSWNILEETGKHDLVHLSDYYPELYKKKHPKKFKSKSLKWYLKFKPELFKNKLNDFLNHLEIKN